MINRPQTESETPKYNPDPIGTYLQAADSTHISSFEVGLRGALRGLITIPTLAEEGIHALLGTPDDAKDSFKYTYDMLKSPNLDKLSQKGIDFVGNLAGQALAPGGTFLAKGGELAGSAVSDAASYFLGKAGTKIAEKEIPKLGMKGLTTETLGEFGRRSAQLGGGFAGFSAPEAFEEAYDVKTNTFNYNKALISTGANGVLGATIPTGQFLLGLLGARITDKALGKAAKIEESKKLADTALEKGEITQEQRDWLHDHIHDLDSPEARKQASQILEKEGYSPDSVLHTVTLKLLTEDANRNIHNVVPEQLFSDVGDKTALSDFISHSQIDAMRENPEVANGIDGWTNHIDQELESGNIFLKQLEEEALATEPPHSFSQEDIYNKFISYKAHPKSVEFTVPENVSAKINGKSDVTLLTPQEELRAILTKLTKGEKLRADFQNSRPYHRLEELSEYWPQARKLLDRVHLENARNAQQSFSTILKMYSNLIKAPLNKLANVDNVSKYLKDRIEAAGKPSEQARQTESKSAARSSQKPIQLKMISEEKPNAKTSEPQENEGNHQKAGEENKQAQTENTEAQRVLDDMRRDVNESKGVEGKDAFKQSEKRLKHFQKAEGVLKNLISCVLGTTNGKV